MKNQTHRTILSILFCFLIKITLQTRNWTQCYENYTKNGEIYIYHRPNSTLIEKWACIDGLGRFTVDTSSLEDTKVNRNILNFIYPEHDSFKYLELFYFKFKNQKLKNELCDVKNSKVSQKFFRDTEVAHTRDKFDLLAGVFEKYFDIIKIKMSLDEKRRETFSVDNFGQLKNLTYDPYDPITKNTIIFTHGFSPAPDILGHGSDSEIKANYLNNVTFAHDHNKIGYKFAVSKPAAYLNCLEDSKRPNIFILLWIPLSFQPYDRAGSNTRAAGRFVANFLTEAYIEEKVSKSNENKNYHSHFDFNKVTLVGFSLGAHTMGIAGKQIQHKMLEKSKYSYHDQEGNLIWPKNSTKVSKIGRIIGVDPASFMFTETLHPNSNSYLKYFRLLPSDANQVIGLHTDNFSPLSGQGCGSYKLNGHIDIFPHNGTTIPRCRQAKDPIFNNNNLLQKLHNGYGAMDKLNRTLCDHISAPEMFGEAIKRQVLGLSLITAYKVDLPPSKSLAANDQTSQKIENRENAGRHYYDFHKSPKNNYCQDNSCYPLMISNHLPYSPNFKNITGQFYMLTREPQRNSIGALEWFNNQKQNQFCVDHVLLDMLLSIRHRTSDFYQMEHKMDLEFELGQGKKNYVIENLETFVAGGQHLKFGLRPENPASIPRKRRKSRKRKHFNKFKSRTLIHPYRILTTLPCSWRDSHKTSEDTLNFIKNLKVRLFFSQIKALSNFRRPISLKYVKLSFLDRKKSIDEIEPGFKLILCGRTRSFTGKQRCANQRRLFRDSEVEEFYFDYLVSFQK